MDGGGRLTDPTTAEHLVDEIGPKQRDERHFEVVMPCGDLTPGCIAHLGW